MTDLPHLIAAVEAASGPDREIDADVMQTVDPTIAEKAYRRAQEPCGCPHEMALSESRWRAPAYTASIDAVVALIRREMPGAEWSAGQWNDAVGFAHVGTSKVGSTAATPALALLLALLRAKAQQDETDA